MQHYRNLNIEGDLNDVRFYNRALPETEIASLFDAAEE